MSVLGMPKGNLENTEPDQNLGVFLWRATPESKVSMHVSHKEGLRSVEGREDKVRLMVLCIAWWHRHMQFQKAEHSAGWYMKLWKKSSICVCWMLSVLKLLCVCVCVYIYIYNNWNIHASLYRVCINYRRILQNLIVCDFLLWGFVKDNVYVPPLPKTLPELRERINTTIRNITQDMLERVWWEWEYCLDICRVTRQAHIRCI
jgi:hypothetical protein